MALDDYRALYDMVGRRWHWVNRRHLDDRQLAALIHHPATEIYRAAPQRRPIGYVELNFKLFPQVEIVFLGLVESEIGNGLGPRMMKSGACKSSRSRPESGHYSNLHARPPGGLAALSALRLCAPVSRKQVEIIDD